MKPMTKKTIPEPKKESSICMCCALNSADYPGICCKQDPFGEGTDVLKCSDYLTEIEQEDGMRHYYKHYDIYKKIGKLNHQIWLLNREITLKDREDAKNETNDRGRV
jgi:hypothetical protein